MTTAILVVDDDETIARLQGELLRNRGFTAIVFSDALQAYEMFKRSPERFGLALIDQTMPGMTGIELSKELLGINPELPIILNTAQGDQDYTEVAREAGIKGYLTKPIPSEVLFSEISKLLS